ncbi:MAG: ferritin family protein [Methanophagales archaeon]|nr:ferritin family protein [Methanophagales archaeon]
MMRGEEPTEERLKALEIAMKLEEDGKKFYMDAREKAPDIFAKEMFESRAKDEDVHVEKVKAVYQRLKEEKKWPRLVTSIGDVVKIKAVFPKDARDLNITKEEIPGQLEILNLGIEMEEKSIELYDGLAGKASDPFEVRFFVALVHEERGHYLSLWDYREYLMDPVCSVVWYEGGVQVGSRTVEYFWHLMDQYHDVGRSSRFGMHGVKIGFNLDKNHLQL